MYRRDLSKFYNYEPCNIYNVGFLHPGKNYVKGAVDALLLPKLVSMQKREQVNLMRSTPFAISNPAMGAAHSLLHGAIQKLKLPMISWPTRYGFRRQMAPAFTWHRRRLYIISMITNTSLQLNSSKRFCPLILTLPGLVK